MPRGHSVDLIIKGGLNVHAHRVLYVVWQGELRLLHTEISDYSLPSLPSSHDFICVGQLILVFTALAGEIKHTCTCTCTCACACACAYVHVAATRRPPTPTCVRARRASPCLYVCAGSRARPAAPRAAARPARRAGAVR